MKRSCFVFLALAVLVICDSSKASPARVRRQGWAWGGGGESEEEQQWVVPPSRPPRPPPGNPGVNPDPNASTTTLAPPAFTACVNSCPTTPQYNPVCGSNRVTYDNAGKLNCAVMCGLDIQELFKGTCLPVTR